MDGNKSINEIQKGDPGPIRPEIAQIVNSLYSKDLAARRKEEYEAKLARLRRVSQALAVSKEIEEFEEAVQNDSDLVDIDWLREKLAHRLQESEGKTSIETAAWMAAFDCKPFVQSIMVDPPTQEEKDILYLERLVQIPDPRRRLK